MRDRTRRPRGARGVTAGPRPLHPRAPCARPRPRRSPPPQPPRRQRPVRSLARSWSRLQPDRSRSQERRQRAAPSPGDSRLEFLDHRVPLRPQPPPLPCSLGGDSRVGPSSGAQEADGNLTSASLKHDRRRRMALRREPAILEEPAVALEREGAEVCTLGHGPSPTHRCRRPGRHAGSGGPWDVPSSVAVLGRTPRS